MYSLKIYLNLAEASLKKYNYKWLLTDENIGYVAEFAMFRYNKFNPELGLSRMTYTLILMKYAILRIITENKKKRPNKTNQDIYVDNIESRNAINDLINKDFLESIKNKIGHKKYELLYRYYGLNESLESIAKDFGITRQRVHQTLTLGLKSAKTAIKENEHFNRINPSISES